MVGFTKPVHEVAEVFRQYGSAYRTKYSMSYHTHHIINNIENCRTSMMGGHIDQCSNCSTVKIAYNSCGNRHCPKCQGMNQLAWIDKRQEDVLPVNHFHLVFTIPSELNALTLMNKKVLYDILFEASRETVMMLARDKKYLGATPGIISVLHTWGQNLMDHPHVHMIVTGGGITSSQKWASSSKKFFLPVRVMSKVFRGKFLSKLKTASCAGKLNFGKQAEYRKPSIFNTLLTTLYNKQWVVYAKKPFGNANAVIKYLGKYTHRIAISNHRISEIKAGKVSFSWKDYADNNRQKQMTLQADEFMRRFLLHTLPKRFCKIRYSGLFSSRFKRDNLALARKKLHSDPLPVVSDKNWQEKILRLTGHNVMQCSRCQLNTMQTIKILKQGESP